MPATRLLPAILPPTFIRSVADRLAAFTDEFERSAAADRLTLGRGEARRGLEVLRNVVRYVKATAERQDRLETLRVRTVVRGGGVTLDEFTELVGQQDPAITTFAALYAASHRNGPSNGYEPGLSETAFLGRLGRTDGYVDPADVIVRLAALAIEDRGRALIAAETEFEKERDKHAADLAQLAQLQELVPRATQMIDQANGQVESLMAERDQLNAELVEERAVSEFLRSLDVDDEDESSPFAGARRDKRVSVEGEEFISRRERADGSATFYVWHHDPADPRGKHHRAGATLEEAITLRAELHPQFGATADAAEVA
jgi:hypothetical protein